ncbi:cat eye syndrome critical region protein 5 [Plakobranchus ocellatus]|uniref:Cat eye syndrome critical region protein 5 n=1 Tax=Plakobranchus ocellatus TaxID=259542 RepID=A0AAV4A508_9GAST|nr:cat eye syndrome critical region protein 5 [Plakobranchus ocellatus]
MACRGGFLAHKTKGGLHSANLLLKTFQCLSRRFHKQRVLLKRCDFGFLFDIDGVIVRGRKPLPFAREAFALLTENKKFKIPTLFVTNAGNCLRTRKAQQLSEWLGVEVSEEQVVLSHSPLKMFRQFHDKHVLVSGQGPIAEIAANIGFNRITTVEQLAQHYPELDKMDHSRRKAAPCAFEEFYPRIDEKPQGPLPFLLPPYPFTPEILVTEKMKTKKIKGVRMACQVANKFMVMDTMTHDPVLGVNL